MVNDPREALVAFLSALPQTIRDNVLLSTFYFLEGQMPEDTSDLAWRIETRMAGDRWPGALANLVQTIGVLDYLLNAKTAEAPAIEATMRRLAASHPDVPDIERMLLQQPLTARHLDLALVDWTVLRTRELSLGNLMRFERTLRV